MNWTARTGYRRRGCAPGATAEDLARCEPLPGSRDVSEHSAGRDALLDACRRCYASLFTDCAIS